MGSTAQDSGVFLWEAYVSASEYLFFLSSEFLLGGTFQFSLGQRCGLNCVSQEGMSTS